MDLKQALDFLASNCPVVFEPISKEINRLKKESETISDKIDLAQNALNDLIFNTLGDGK